MEIPIGVCINGKFNSANVCECLDGWLGIACDVKEENVVELSGMHTIDK